VSDLTQEQKTEIANRTLAKLTDLRCAEVRLRHRLRHDMDKLTKVRELIRQLEQCIKVDET
jgi:hypothetical protein